MYLVLFSNVDGLLYKYHYKEREGSNGQFGMEKVFTHRKRTNNEVNVYYLKNLLNRLYYLT